MCAFYLPVWGSGMACIYEALKSTVIKKLSPLAAPCCTVLQTSFEVPVSFSYRCQATPDELTHCVGYSLGENAGYQLYNVFTLFNYRIML